MEGTLKVTPQQLEATAQGMEKEVSRLLSLAGEMSDIANQLRSGWEGEAATAYINKVNAEKQDVDDCVQKVRKRLGELRQKAQNYAAAESANESTAERLAVDVVQL